MYQDLKNQKKEERTTKELIVKEEVVGNMMTISILDETIDQIISISDEAAIWGKVVEGGFLINDKTFPELEGIICRIHPYLIKWENKRAHRLPNVSKDEEIPEGYERRIDLKVLVAGQLIGLSISKSSVKYHLSPYLRYLKNRGFRPEDVVTRLRSKQVSNVHGTFNVVVFEMFGSAKNATVNKVETPSEFAQGTSQAVSPNLAVEETPSAIPTEWR